MPAFSGLIPPLVTPLTDGGAVDRESLGTLVSSQIEAGVDGVFVLGSSGEAAYLTDAARVEVVEAAIAAAAGRVPVIAGAVDTATERVIAQVHLLEQPGLAGIVATSPFYANPNETETAAHFRAIAAAASVPVLAYDIPGNVGRRLPWAVAIELLRDGTIAGLKDSSGSLTEFRFILDALGNDRPGALLTGADILADLALALGADGLIPGLANARPEFFVQLIHAHASGDTARVAVVQRAVTALSDIFNVGQRHGTGRHASELGALKHLLRVRGVIASTTVSRPMSSLPATAVEELDRLVGGIDDRLGEELAALD